ncbi:MAG: hypothetical protein ACI9YM_000477 [Brevundimonas sp.]|jgi:hypothetical protein|tara:strand:- start:170 stop:283 length:114 start_codon:yes stop_codon:yes gene_type:complete
MHYVAPVRLVATVEPKTLKLMALLVSWLAAGRPAATS